MKTSYIEIEVFAPKQIQQIHDYDGRLPISVFVGDGQLTIIQDQQSAKYCSPQLVTINRDCIIFWAYQEVETDFFRKVKIKIYE